MVLALLLALGAVSCAPGRAPLARPAPELLPPGSPLRSPTLAEGDAWLRHHLMFGEHAQALGVLDRRSGLAPSDRLLRALQEAVVLHEAGDHARSNQVLEWAEVEADRRYTRSVSRAAASLMVNDAVMGYTPTPTELTMVAYYRMLNYLAMDRMEGALVEARKANALYDRLRRGPLERCREDGMVQYLAALVQRAGGETDDALISLRHAEAAFSACPGGRAAVPEALAADLHRTARAAGHAAVADSAADRYGLATDSLAGSDSGDVVLLLEHGFVAHLAEQALHVPIFPEDVEGLHSGDGDGVVAAAARIGERLVRGGWERAAWGQAVDDHPVVQVANALEGAYVLRLAWPVYRREAGRPAAVRVWVGDSLVAASPVGDLSSLVHDELEAQRPAMLSRMLARGLTKYLVSRQVEKRAERQAGQMAALVLGRLANLAANRLEQADTRSWSLLPDGVSMSRLRLPPGSYTIRVETTSPRGASHVRELGPVLVEAGRLAVLCGRVWGEEAGEPFPPRPRTAPAGARSDSAAAL